MISPEEIERRVPAWSALSELFLDTELLDADYARLRAALAECGYSSAELRAILYDEVAPVLGFNLFSVAGEWMGWSEADLRRLLLPQVQRPRRGGWIVRIVLRRYLAREWAKVDPGR